MSNSSFEGRNSSLPSSSSGLREFSLAEIEKATNNFDQSLLLRRGWISEVYKGSYDDIDEKRRTVTIKVFKFEVPWQQAMKTWFGQWFEQQRNGWSQYHHENVVPVIGYCHEFGVNIVVYQHMVNGSLAQHLCTKITPTSFYLSWEQCLHICIDAASGLEYMHTHIRNSKDGAFVLYDVSVNNILLDENGVAKICDLCYEPLLKVNDEPAYCFDPEFQSTDIPQQSSDVYAYGVLLVKVLSRKVSFDKEDRNLGIWFKKCILNGTIQDQIIHPDMKQEISPDCLTALVDISGECLNSESTKRPSIAQVVKKLKLLIPSSTRPSCDFYSLRDIEEATNNFESILWEGREGTVYKGMTKTNTGIAVKRLKSEFSFEFEKEIKMLLDLDHPNLVSLVGYCNESDQNILIYELMSNGNLAQSFYRKTNPLSWTKRLNICIGVARGLRYLHTRTNIPQEGIINSDVKPVNILLDENFNAKISYFGPSKMGLQAQANSEIASMIKGTIDVSAFGVVLSEVLCGKKPWDQEESFYPSENEKFHQWADKNMDLDLKGEIAPISLELYVGLLEKCLNRNPNRRPSMNDIVNILEYAQKWQESWQRHKSGGDFCLPGGKDRVILYCTTNSKSCIEARLLLRRYAKNVDERDLANDLSLMELKYALGNTGDIHKPQLFVNGKHINEIEKLHATGKLAELLGLQQVLVCDTCQEARSCSICKRIEWYIHCNNCGALTLVRRYWQEGQLRTCFHCNADQLICNDIKTTENIHLKQESEQTLNDVNTLQPNPQFIQTSQDMSTLSLEGGNSSLPSSSSTSSGIREFSLAEIKKATNNFDQALLLWRGWVSDVYKGSYDESDGKRRTVTIKSFNFGSLYSWKQTIDTWFEHELKWWSQYRHKHVVLVMGYCRESDENIIVYEHMVNGSLAQHLCTKITPTGFYMSWDQCLQICIDAARGLEYMYTCIKYSSGVKFHLGDVAVANILLDENGVAKLSDLYYEPVTEVNDELAYCFDTESQSTGITQQSSDVYAFGVLLVKVLARKVTFDKEDRNLGIWFNKCILNGIIQDNIIHPEMKAEISPDCLIALVDIAGECLNNESTKRPSITQVIKKLELLMALPSRRLCDRYSLQEIEDVTNNFESILGQGGEGTVYKGVTKTNTSIAVKLLKPELSSEFEKEIKMLSDLDHPNLVSLVGYCHESDQNILIYELMSNGNLAQSLYSTANPLSWTQRLNICIGAARGLRYLHTRTNISQKGIIHRDVNPDNILLDDNFNAKVSDFGLSKMGLEDQAISEISTMVKGTRGYYAPEYQWHGKITRRIDVFAFGVVLTEVLCRKKPWDREESFYPTENEKYCQWAKENMDLDLKGVIAPICLEAYVGMLEKCLNMNPNRRPSMNEVVSVLEYALKWQESWQRHKSGGDFCIPGSEDRIILYCKSNSQSSISARLLLRRYSKNVEERDLSNNLCLMEFKHALRNSGDIDMPQLFVRGKHVGDVKEMEKLHATGKLVELLGLPLKFICDTCQEAKACRICERIEWYIHCKKCGALTLVRRCWQEGQLRTCLQCNADQLMCDGIKAILKG